MFQLSFSPKEGEGVLYEQLYRSIRDQIQSGHLQPGERLPGKRSLASSLSVSVNTVDTAYQMLCAEGYLESRPRSGFFVQRYDGPIPPPTCQAPLQPDSPAPRWRYDLSTGGVDLNQFPFRTWGRIQKELLYSQPQLLNRGHGQGDWELRVAIAQYLQANRGVDCLPKQIVVGAGIEYLLGLLAPMLPGVAGLEDPGYQRSWKIFSNHSTPCVPLKVDWQGLCPDSLKESPANIVYVTPSHQFPTGGVLPAGRRAALLQWASDAPGRCLIEDDYDSEFRFHLRPLPSLQGMAGRSGPVVYLTTFSRSLAPGIRIACMVLPTWLLDGFQQRYGHYACTVGRFEQQTLRLFLERGHFTRHLARSRSRYKQKVQTLTSQLKQALPCPLSFYGQHTGLHLVMQLSHGPQESQLVEKARAAGVALTGLSTYAVHSTVPERSLVLGYGALEESQIPALCQTLSQCWFGE